MQPTLTFVTPPVLEREVDLAIIMLQKESDAICAHPSIEASAYYHHKAELLSMQTYGIYLAQWPKIPAKGVLFVVHPPLAQTDETHGETIEACLQQAILATQNLEAKTIAITSLDTKKSIYPMALMIPRFLTNLHRWMLESPQTLQLEAIFIGSRDPLVRAGLQTQFEHWIQQ
ncbi:MAG: hypothetical protein ACRCZJ_03320 [Erysipelotrichaceae bacterium]